MNYTDIKDDSTRKLFKTFHSLLTWHFETINSRLYSRYYLANDSRELIKIINELKNIKKNLIELQLEFSIDNYYENIIKQLEIFLEYYRGTIFPEDFEKIEIAETKPIFHLNESIRVSNQNNVFYGLKNIGSGSYATVSKYKDEFYNKTFAVKKAFRSLTPKEKERFKKEFEEMRKLNSPYILKVYNFNESHYNYTMEYADTTMKEYIDENNTKLELSDRKGLVIQVIRGFKYIETKSLLHRDIVQQIYL